MSRDVAGQHNRAGIRMAGAQVVKEFLAEIRDRLRVAHEEVGLGVDHNAMGLGERRRDVHFSRWRCFVKSSVNFLRQFQIRLEDEHAPSRRGFIGGMARRRFVHEFKKAGELRDSFAGHALMDRCLLSRKWKAVFLVL
jgi:hypothetical protein